MNFFRLEKNNYSVTMSLTIETDTTIEDIKNIDPDTINSVTIGCLFGYNRLIRLSPILVEKFGDKRLYVSYYIEDVVTYLGEWRGEVVLHGCFTINDETCEFLLRTSWKTVFLCVDDITNTTFQVLSKTDWDNVILRCNPKPYISKWVSKSNWKTVKLVCYTNDEDCGWLRKGNYESLTITSPKITAKGLKYLTERPWGKLAILDCKLNRKSCEILKCVKCDDLEINYNNIQNNCLDILKDSMFRLITGNLNFDTLFEIRRKQRIKDSLKPKVIPDILEKIIEFV